MMLALWPTVMARRPFRRAKSKANRTIRRVPETLIGLTVTPASSRMSNPASWRSTERSRPSPSLPISNSIPAYRSSVFSLMTTRSTLEYREGTPGRLSAGRTAANRSSSWRRATFTLRNPDPTGVVIGPFSAVLVASIDLRTRSGSGVPSRARTAAPASCTSHTTSTPELSTTRRAAAVTSGPIPSPGMSVMR